MAKVNPQKTGKWHLQWVKNGKEKSKISKILVLCNLTKIEFKTTKLGTFGALLYRFMKCSYEEPKGKTILKGLMVQ